MKIYRETSLESFDAWGDAIGTLDKVREAGKCDELESIIEELYPDGMSETGLNDLLWFEPETVFKWLGIEEEEEEG